MASAFGSSVLPQNNIKKSFKIKKKTLKTAELVLMKKYQQGHYRQIMHL